MMIDAGKTVGKHRKRSRRGNHEGCIQKRKDGRYMASVMHNGERKWAYARTRGEVVKRLDELRERIKRGFPLVDDVTLIDLAEHYLDHYADGFVRPSTLANYRGYVDNHIRPYAIAKCLVSKLNKDLIQIHVNGLKCADGSWVSPKTQRNFVQFLKSVLATAVDNGLLLHNPAERLKCRPANPRKRPVLTDDDIGRLIKEATSHKWKIGIEILTEGMRISELLALRWSSIIVVDGIHCLNIDQALKRQPKNDPCPDGNRTELVLAEPKTASSVRIVPIRPSLWESLERHMAFQRECAAKCYGWFEADPFLISDDLGRKVDPGTFRKFFIEMAARSGIPTARPHDMRHFAASEMMRKGASPVAAAKVLGDLPQTMLNVYCDEHVQGKLDALMTLEK